MHILNQDKPEGEVDMDIIRGKVLDPVRQESQEESYMNSTEKKRKYNFLQILNLSEHQNQVSCQFFVIKC